MVIVLIVATLFNMAALVTYSRIGRRVEETNNELDAAMS